VAAQCLDWAIKTNQHAGVWGGMSEDERQALRRSRQRRHGPSSWASAAGSARPSRLTAARRPRRRIAAKRSGLAEPRDLPAKI